MYLLIKLVLKTTPVADVGLFTRMDPLMHVQLMKSAEESATVFTLELLYIYNKWQKYITLESAMRATLDLSDPLFEVFPYLWSQM